MAILTLAWSLSPSTLIAAGYVTQAIQVQTTPPIGAWVELTRPHLRIPIAQSVERYLWEVPGVSTYGYRSVPVKEDGTLGTPISISSKTLRGYCTISEVRAEGYANPPHTDARVQAAIDRATSMIDQVCGQRFDAYYAVVTLDVKKIYDEHHLDVPIIAALQVIQVNNELDRQYLVIGNRHLTQGLTNPDDRRNPMVSFGDDVLPMGEYGGRFAQGRRTLTIKGIFGFTEVGADDMVGETEEGSQVPLTYGSTPLDIKQACLLLVSGYLPTIASGGDESSIRARVISESTQDQSYSLQALPTEEASFGITGNLQVDNILMRYRAPMRLGAV